jgi:hypothetical protein
MELRNGLYRLERILDDPRYEGFASDGTHVLTDGLPPNPRERSWKKLRMTPSWRPVRVIGRVRKFNDFPCVDLMPAFSQRAVDALRDLLVPNGELLPLLTPLGSYFAYNVTTIVDALDVRRSQIKWIKKPLTAFEVERFEIFPAKIEGYDVFHMPETASDVYVTQAFVTRATDCGLKGFDFQRVWPFPARVDWRAVARDRRNHVLAEGLPAGQTVKGNTIVIRLFLAGAKSKGTAAESRRINEIMNEIDAMLVNVRSSAPAVGNLEGFDYGAPGECRLFLSCPDADALADELRPWLSKLDWPNGMSILKRYGVYTDKDAPETVVELS